MPFSLWYKMPPADDGNSLPMAAEFRGKPSIGMALLSPGTSLSHP
jgi:hypothetical protein